MPRLALVMCLITALRLEPVRTRLLPTDRLVNLLPALLLQELAFPGSVLEIANLPCLFLAVEMANVGQEKIASHVLKIARTDFAIAVHTGVVRVEHARQAQKECSRFVEATRCSTCVYLQFACLGSASEVTQVTCVQQSVFSIFMYKKKVFCGVSFFSFSSLDCSLFCHGSSGSIVQQCTQRR